MNRRTWLKLACSATASAAFPSLLSVAAPDDAIAFSESQLDDLVRKLAEAPYAAPEKRLDEALANINLDQYRAITFKPENAVWREDSLAFRLSFFQAAGSFYAYPVDIYTVEAGRASKFPYSPQLFTFSPPVRAPQPNSQSGFAGLRVLTKLNDPTIFEPFVTFLGATNFRAIASGQVSGRLSARGLAINTGQPGGEEFPFFRTFYVERPSPSDQAITIHAILDITSTAGRYKFVCKPGRDSVIEVEAVIYPRKRMPYVGIAPMTSMFFSGPSFPPKRLDYRPRVHDSDALSMLNGAGEWIWRPLINPERLQFSVFLDKNPRGFGLVQRSRNFADYQDLDQKFERRPTLWVEPLDDWGEGSIDLIELPATEELHENIVAFWRPKDGLAPGMSHKFRYRMHWCWEPPVKSNKAAVSQTRIGEGKNGEAQFVVDFFPFDTCELCGDAALAANVTASAGEVRNVDLRQNPAAGGHRLRFDYMPSGNQPIDLRAILQANGKPVSETWIFRWTR